MIFHISYRIFFVTFVSVHSVTAGFFSCRDYYLLSTESESDVKMEISFNCASLEGHIVHSNYFDESDKTAWKYSCKLETFRNVTYKPYTDAFEIDFNSCRFTYMPSVFFHRFRRVHKIQMDNSNIETINNEALPKNCSLERLAMSFNKLTELPPLLFLNAPNITEIDFSNNEISNIHPNTFRGQMTNFKVINLRSNHIETLDKLLLIDLLNLEELDLSYNFIEDFQTDLSKLKNLSILRLNNNKIIELHCGNVLNLVTSTIHIDVSMNSLKVIDLNCSVTLKSVSLNINDNYLESLTFPASKLVNSLTEFKASGNRIVSIYTESNKNKARKVFYPRNLKLLDLSHNNLTKIDFELLSPFFKNLIDLYLNDNHLTDLIGWTETDFTNLKRFNILNNQWNCSYLQQFLKLLPKRVTLMKKDALSIRLNRSGNISESIHGIDCIEDNNSSTTYFGDTENQMHAMMKKLDGIVYYLIFLTTLTIICIIIKVLEWCKGNNARKPNAQSVIYHSYNSK